MRASLFRVAMTPQAKQSFLVSIKGNIHVAKLNVDLLIETRDVESAKQLCKNQMAKELKDYE